VGAVSDRHLSWDGCVNVRDLGGLLTTTGSRTRRGVVVRADNIRRLTPAGWQRAVHYGVRRVVDLRFPGEEPGEPGLHELVDVVGIPLFGQHNPAAGQPLADALRNTVDVGAVFGHDYVRSLQEHQQQFGAAVTAVAEVEEPVVVHCFAGKDRTGLVAALLLSVAGVTDEAIVSDYALSEPNMGDLLGAWIADGEDEADRRLRARMGQAPAAAMAAVLGWIRREGGTEAYLREAGVVERHLRGVRARLV
jgi:protein-tyrosine phosphatase